jgi:hypothetical protein
MVVSSTQITCTTPPGTAGPASLIVSVTGTTSASTTYTYINDPTITGISPTSGLTTGGTPVTISGTNLTNATVTIGGVSVSNLMVVSSTQITCTTPPGTAGPASLIVSVTGTTSASTTYTYIDDTDPTITEISPATGTTEGGTSVIITGTGFTGASSVTFGTSVASFSVTNDTSIICYTPSGSGTVDVIVTVSGIASNSLTYTYKKTVISNICFPAGTPVTTDQGNIPIEQINLDIHTINNNKIVAITKTITQDTYLVCFEKHSLGVGCPNKKTITSKHHKVYYNGVMTKADEFLKQFKWVKKVDYNGEILYNVLMEKHDKINVNNLTFETLDPENIIAKLYTSNFDEEYKDTIIVMINNSITQKDHRLYQNIINHIVHDKNLSTGFEELDHEEPEYNKLDEVITTRIETINDYAGNLYNITVTNNLDNNVNLQSKLKKYIKIYKNKDSTYDIIKKKKLLNNIKKKK